MLEGVRLNDGLGLVAGGKELGQVCCLDQHSGGSFHVDCGLWRRELGSGMVCGHNRMVFVDGRPSGLTHKVTRRASARSLLTAVLDAAGNKRK